MGKEFEEPESISGPRIRLVPGFDRYAISDAGDVFSLYDKGKLRPVPARMKLTDHKGYKTVILYTDGNHKKMRVHKLVLLAFSGPKPDGFESAHLNGIRSDNRIENLKWVAPKENHHHKLIHGTRPRGDNASHRKLSEAQVRQIIKMRNEKPRSALAKEYGVCKRTIANIMRGESWWYLDVHAIEAIPEGTE